MHFPSSAVVNINTPPGSRHTNTTSSSRHGVILGVSLGVFGWYVSTVPHIDVHFYRFLPAIGVSVLIFNFCGHKCAGNQNTVRME